MEFTTIEIKAYKTPDGAIFKDIDEAECHEETLKKADILCSNRVRFFDDNFVLLTAQYEKFDDTFFDEDNDQFWELRSVLEHAAYYYCEDDEAAKAVVYFGRDIFGIYCYETAKKGYWDVSGDCEPINLLEVLANTQKAIAAMNAAKNHNS